MKWMMVGIVSLALAPLAVAQYAGRGGYNKAQSEAAGAKAAQQDRAAAAQVSGNDENELRQLEQNWANALMKHDSAPIEQITSADFQWTGPDGDIKDKKAFVDDFGRKPNDIGKVQTRSMDVRTFGNSAVVTGEKEMDGHTAFGKSFSGKYRFTHVYVKQDGQWKLVSAQLTHIG